MKPAGATTSSQAYGSFLQTTLDAKVSRKVLSMARDQQDELAQEDLDEWADELECVAFSLAASFAT